MSGRLQLLLGSTHRPRVLRAALLLGIVLALGVCATGSEWLRLARRVQALESEQAALQAAVAESDARRNLSEGLSGREARVRALRQRGFMSAADRVAWVESVTAAVEALRPLRYKVEVGAEAPQPLPPETQTWYDERGRAAPRLVANEMRLEVDGLQETEVVALLEQARRAGGAVVRIERCRLERRESEGALGASCTLRRFAMLPPAAPEAAT